MKLNVGVMRGGISSEYEMSLKSGGVILANLDREKYHPVDLLVDKDGVLHADGLPIDAKKLRSIVDVIWNSLHGGPGENGTVQKILDDLAIPYIGSGSENILNKVKTKEKLKGLDLRTPYGLNFVLPRDIGEEDFESYTHDFAKQVFNRISPPWIVKPSLGGASIDTFIAKDFPELLSAMKKALEKHEDILVEEYISGREVSIGMIEDFRGEEDYALLPVEIRHQEKKYPILDYENRNNGNYLVLHPKDLDKKEKESLFNALKGIKNKLDLSHYFTADFILTPRGIYLLEVDALPHMHDTAVFPKALALVGAKMPEFVNNCVELALKGKKDAKVRKYK